MSYLTFLFPTLTYTTFTLKTFKGQFTTKVRTCFLKYLPRYLLKDNNFVLFSKRIFTIKHDVGIARTLKTQEIIFMYKNSHFGRYLKTFMSYYTIKISCLHAFRNKTKQKIKIQGSSKHYDT